ncbi:MAG TPA: hypothetical protein VFZ71_04755 [Pyrinomonadaceae bacterium]
MRLDIDKDGKPDILERWWNGKRVRWLDENGDMLPSDTRGDQVADVMQIDKNDDGLYDSALDINIKWIDNDGDGRADLQAFVTQGREWSNNNWDAGQPNPDVATLFDLHKEGWKGLNALFTTIANQSFQEALTVYRAAWRRGLTTPEIDRLASASAVGERHDHAYWLKEKIFREIRARVRQEKLDGLEKDLTRLYYTGQFAAYARLIAQVPAR